MNILAVDSSTAVAGVAITRDDTLLAERSIGFGRKHSRILASMIRGVLDDTGLEPEDIGLFAAAVGPGSFTGLRIGISMIKAMAYALDKPVCGISTLDALAYNAFPATHLVCPIMDARNSQVFTAIYRWCGGDIVRLTGYLAVGIDEIASTAAEFAEDILFTGDAIRLHEQYLSKELGARCSFAHSGTATNRASSVALLAHRKALENQTSSSFELLPVYLRKPQAERMRDIRDGGGGGETGGCNDVCRNDSCDGGRGDRDGA